MWGSISGHFRCGVGGKGAMYRFLCPSRRRSAGGGINSCSGGASRDSDVPDEGSATHVMARET